MSNGKNLESLSSAINPLVEKPSGLIGLTFKYEGITFEVSAEAYTHPRSILPFIRVPMKLTFPSGKVFDIGNAMDLDKKVFIHLLVEDNIMQEYFPEEFLKHKEVN